jgi:FkbM family methyltransferase
LANAFILKQLTASLFRAFFNLGPFRKTYFGFYTRLFKPYNLFKGVRKRVLYKNKFTLELAVDDWIQQNLYFLQEYEEKEMKFLESFLKKGDVFIDIGANIGLYSLVASELVGLEGKVFAFEPLRKNHEALQKYLQLNSVRNVTLEKLAVSDKPGTIALHLNEEDSNNGMATAFADSFTFSETVPTVPLDLHFANEPDLKINLIKIDIEGGEFLALKGMEGLLKKYKPALLLEIDPNILERTPFQQEDIETFLAELGYRKFYLKPDGALTIERPVGYQSHNYVFGIDLEVTD